MTDPAGRHDAWVRLLDDLAAEASGLREQATTTDAATAVAPWQEPAALGPLPGTLAGRAQEVLAAQEDAITVISAAMERARRHHDAVAAVPRPHPAGPVYIDLRG